MFTNRNVFVTLNNKSLEVRRVLVTQDTQKEITSSFAHLMEELLYSRPERIPFDGRYKPEANEICYISNYNLPVAIRRAISDPMSMEYLELDKKKLPSIKHIFIGTNEPELIVVFQNFTTGQYLLRKGWTLMQSSDTFEHFKGTGFVIDNRIDCVYRGDSLLFTSYWTARQVLDLSSYYREATENEVISFMNLSHFDFECKDTFYGHTDSWVRRKIALLNDSEVLKKHSVEDIAKEARTHGINLEVKQVSGMSKLVVPKDKKRLKTLLSFLDEDIYTGPLTDNKYITNSKRQYSA